MKSHARVVIVGGGVVGVGTLYALIKKGWTDVVLLDQRIERSNTNNTATDDDNPSMRFHEPVSLACQKAKFAKFGATISAHGERSADLATGHV